MAVPFFSVFRHALLRKHHEAVKRKGRKPSPQSVSAPALQAGNMKGAVLLSGAFLVKRNPPQLGWGFKRAFSFTYIVKIPFDLLALSCGLATAVNNKSKGGHYG